MYSIINYLMIFAFLLFSSCKNSSNENIKTTINTMQTKDTTAIAANTPVDNQNESKPKHFKVKVIKSITHDPGSFTQGLIYYKGFFYESTGLRGESSFRKLEVATGKVLKKIDVPGQYFSEGIAIFNDKIYMLTWLSGICFVYDMASFVQLDSYNYAGEGWGLTNDDKALIMSDGSNVLKFINPENFHLEKTLSVADGNEPVKNLNELEYVDGLVYANIWMQDKIAAIDAESGAVKFWIDLSELRKYVTTNHDIDVLNGIAYNKEKGRFYLTGKYWPFIFEVDFVEEK